MEEPKKKDIINVDSVDSSDVRKRAEELRDRAKKFIFEEEDWGLVKERNGVNLYSKSFPDVSSIDCAKVHVVLKDIQAKEAANLVWTMKDETFKQTNPDFGAYETVDTLSDSLKVYRSVANVPWPLWPRELVFYSHFIEDDHGYWIIQESCKHKDAPHNKSKHVRARLFLGVFFFEKDQDTNNTSFWRLWHFEPKGNVPTFVINAKLERFLSQIEELIRLIRE
jgi:hypothetical protein